MGKLKNKIQRDREIKIKRANEEGLSAEDFNNNIDLVMLKRYMSDYADIVSGTSKLSLDEQEKIKIIIEEDILNRFTDEDIAQMVKDSKIKDETLLDALKEDETEDKE